MNLCTQRKLIVAKRAPILGVDVGEDFLELALLSADRAALSHHRVALAGIAKPVVESLAKRVVNAVGRNLRGALALVDSPRTPRDIDCSGAKIRMRIEAPRARVIDTSLRELLRARFDGTMRSLSMFPTPLASYFAACAAQRECKPHLRAIAEEILTSAIRIPRSMKSESLAGGTFTRFMLVGFAVFPALERMGVRAFEAYPDLQMRLWSDGIELPPKSLRAEALRARTSISAQLAGIVGVSNYQAPTTLDEADAAVLALSAAASSSTRSLIELHCPAEGRFAVGFKAG